MNQNDNNRQILDVFHSSCPTIDNMFVGRKKELDRLDIVIHRPGAHAVVFGHRGVGKTSFVKYQQA